MKATRHLMRFLLVHYTIQSSSLLADQGDHKLWCPGQHTRSTAGLVKKTVRSARLQPLRKHCSLREISPTSPISRDRRLQRYNMPCLICMSSFCTAPCYLSHLWALPPPARPLHPLYPQLPRHSLLCLSPSASIRRQLPTTKNKKDSLRHTCT